MAHTHKYYRFRWTLPFVALLASLLGPQLAQADLAFLISDASGNTNFTNVQPNSSYNLIIYALVQDANGTTVGTSGDWFEQAGGGVQVSDVTPGGLVASGDVFFPNNPASNGGNGWGNVQYPSNSTGSTNTVPLWSSGGSIGIGCSSSGVLTSASSDIFCGNSGKWKTTNPGGIPAAPSKIVSAFSNYTVYPFAEFTMDFGASLPYDTAVSLAFIPGTATVPANIWYENRAVREQNGNNTYSGLGHGSIYYGPNRNGMLDIVTFSTFGYVSPATYLSPATISNLREMQGSTAQLGSITVTNCGGASGTFTLTNSGANALTFGTSSGTLTAFGGTSSSLGWASTTTTGSQNGIIGLTGLVPGDQGFLYGPQTATVSGAVVTNRTVIASTVDLGAQHTGANLGLMSGTTTLTSPGPNSQFTSVTVGGATFDGTTTSGTAAVSGTINLVASGGTLSTLPVTTAENGGGGLPGEGSYVDVIVPYTAEVTSGNAIWTGIANGSWGTQASANWVDSGGTVHAAPGTFAGFINTDTATFSGSGSVTAIDLTGVNPSLNALSFSNSSYTLSNGSLTLNGSTGTATVTVSSGTQSINTPMTLASNTNFAVNGGALLLNSAISGSGGFTKSGSAGLTLAGADTLSSTGPIAITQGTLIASLGISHAGGGITLTAGATLQAAGQVKGAVTGAGTVTATGDLFIGVSTQSGQFNQGGSAGVGGTLNVGGNAVAILSADTAVLGSQTNIGAGGSLTALNGVQLGNPTSVDNTKILTATGSATIKANFVNNGLVNGPTCSGQELTFTQAVQGAGSTTGNVEYAASYNVGNSPDAVSVQNVLLDSTSTLIMELAGTQPGSGYDQLDISGLATLNGTLELSYLDDFSPSIGDSFELFSGPTTGSFEQIDLPALSDGKWNTSNLYTNGTISVVVPEPSTFVLLGVGAIGLVGYAWRRKRKGV